MKMRPMVWADALSQSLNVPHEQRKDRIRYFVRLLQKKRMRKLLPLILRSLDARTRKDSVFIESAIPLSQQYLDRHAPSLRAVICAPKNAPIYSTVNPAVCGGIIIRFNDYEYDATILRQLENMEELLWQSQ